MQLTPPFFIGTRNLFFFSLDNFFVRHDDQGISALLCHIKKTHTNIHKNVRCHYRPTDRLRRQSRRDEDSHLGTFVFVEAFSSVASREAAVIPDFCLFYFCVLFAIRGEDECISPVLLLGGERKKHRPIV